MTITNEYQLAVLARALNCNEEQVKLASIEELIVGLAIKINGLVSIIEEQAKLNMMIVRKR